MHERSDLTAEEQANVRVALRFLRARCGGWDPLAKLLHVKEKTISHISTGGVVTASVAVRVARLAKVGIDDLLAGKYPPEGACPYCGHVKGTGDDAEDQLLPGPVMIERVRNNLG